MLLFFFFISSQSILLEAPLNFTSLFNIRIFSSSLNSDNENDTSNHENTTLLEDEARLKERVSNWLEKKDPNLSLKYKRLLAEEKYSPLDLTIRLRNHYLSTAKSWECLKKAKAIQKYLNEKKSFAQQDETVWLFKEEFRYLSKVMQWQDQFNVSLDEIELIKSLNSLSLSSFVLKLAFSIEDTDKDAAKALYEVHDHFHHFEDLMTNLTWMCIRLFNKDVNTKPESSPPERSF